MRWNCESDGCFNELRRPKLEMFADCFPGLINFGDVDGRVEMGGYFCELEWKGRAGSIGVGQRRAFEAVTKTRGNVVFVVEGHANTMEVRRFCRFWASRQHDWTDGDLDAVKASIRGWVQWVQSQRSAA